MSVPMFDETVLRYLSVVKIEGGKPLANISFRGTTVDPDLVAGFVSAVVIFAKTPIRTIRKAAYDIMIEIGESKMVMLVSDPVQDESPYRQRMKKILDLVDSIDFDTNLDYTLSELMHGMNAKCPRWLQMCAFHILLAVKGFSWLGMLDVDPVDIPSRLLSFQSNNRAKSILQKELLRVVLNQIDNGGTTIGLDIGRMALHGELAVRINDVLSQRNVEINNLRLHQDGSNVDLEPLWLTAYGNKVLNALDFGLNCTLDEFSLLKRKLNEIGLQIRLTHDKAKIRSPEMSRGLRDFVLKRLYPLQLQNIDPNDILLSSIMREIVQCNH